MANKVLVIDVEPKSVPNGSTNQWTPLSNTDVFISDIRTPPLADGANIGTLVSGIPTAFARVDMFHNAIKNGKEDAITQGARNLNTYYVELIREWKGFLAALALDYANFEVRRIDLNYSDNKEMSATSNLYEPKGAFGNMLLERRNRWRPVGRDVSSTTPPFINVVKYRGKVVGATSPETLLFTSSGYSIDTGRDALPWVKAGRFTDPLDNSMSEDQVYTLYAYVNYILNNLDKLSGYYAPLNDAFINYTPHRQLLERWGEKIRHYAAERGYDLTKGSVPAVTADFSEPFSYVLTHEDVLYTKDGIITEAQREGSLPFDPKKLLLGTDARIARIHLDSEFNSNPAKLAQLPVHVLKASFKNQPDQYAFFALPLSAQGLDVFGKSIGALVGNAAVGQVSKNRLTAIYDPDARDSALSLELAITTEDTNKTRTFKVNYDVGNQEGIRNHDILIWPNFVSRQWNAYYLFSEMPHNVSANTYSAYPFVGDPKQNFRILKEKDTDLPLALAEQGRIRTPEDHGVEELKIELPVQATPAIAENGYKYEIYRSNMPFKGVRLLSPTRSEGGYLLINYTQEPDKPTLPRDLLNINRQTEEVTLGIDFGSTNTSIAFARQNQAPEGFTFGRQRISLLGNDLTRRSNVPQPNQVLFFQSRETPLGSNAIKSVLTLHTPERLHPLKNNSTDAMRAAEAVTGGFPCFRDNLPVKAVENDTILLQYPRIGRIEQINNMKWNDREMDKSRKTAYLRTLLLQVYAELFQNSGAFVPTRLVWSYPSAMDTTLLLSYQAIWDELGGTKVSPVVSYDRGETIPLEISKYTLDESRFGPDMGGFGGFGGGDGNFGGGNDFGGSSDPFGSAMPAGDPFGNAMPAGDPFGSAPAAAADPFGGGGGADPFAGSDPFGGGGGDPFGGHDPFGGPEGAPAKKKEKEAPDLKPDDPNRVTDYKPKPIFPDGFDMNSLTEATAVANYTSEEVGRATGQLILCFDVGGSTTDISALWMLPEGLTMIKQNSIRFAAQMVSNATRHFPKFENVLRRACAATNTVLLGLNEGDNRYSPDTAPYYFEQIVDRFNDEQLDGLYRLIGAECKELMCVNMYITGLLMFYGGQVARKLIDDLYHLKDRMTMKPSIKVTFAGKGSRLFQWLNIFPNNYGLKYYMQMFSTGYGMNALKSSLSGWPQIMLPSQHSSNIKYEVSMGLAKGNPDLYTPADSNESEIVGESNFVVIDRERKTHPLSDINTLTPEMIRYIGQFFLPAPNSQCVSFTNFCGLYYKSLCQLLGRNLPPNPFTAGLRNINIVQYVQSRPEFRAAQRAAEADQPFDYVAPIIILEGMKYYENTLFNALGR